MNCPVVLSCWIFSTCLCVAIRKQAKIVTSHGKGTKKAGKPTLSDEIFSVMEQFSWLILSDHTNRERVTRL